MGRLANYYPDRFLAFVFIAVPYRNPDLELMPYPVEKLNEESKRVLGYETHGHWLFLADDVEQPAAIMESHVSRAIHCENAELMSRPDGLLPLPSVCSG